jgi:hypothetical protein
MKLVPQSPQYFAQGGLTPPQTEHVFGTNGKIKI